MLYAPRIPNSAPLAGRIETVFYLDGYAPGHTRERLVPDGRMSLVIELDGRERYVFDNEDGSVLQSVRGAWLSGFQTRPITIGETRPTNRLVAVRFAPSGSLPFTHLPASDFADRVVDAIEVFGNELRALREVCARAADPETALDAVCAWLRGRHRAELAASPDVERVVGRLLREPGGVRLGELIEREVEVTQKHLAQLFRRHVGATAKTLQRILRFRSIFEELATREGRVDWAALSAELGYADQSHLIRDFRAFSGYRPGQFADEEHDRTNFFPETDAPR